MMMLRPLFMAMLLLAPAHARDFGQYAQADPAISEWFNAQRNPTTKVPCCSTADGTRAQEEIRCAIPTAAHSPSVECHRWTRFVAATHVYNVESGASESGDDIDSGWMQVPDDTIIYDGGNPNGAAIVWYYFSGPDTLANLRIRCFKPGPDA